MLLLGATTWAQEIRVTGTVTDLFDGTTLPGVTILVKGTTIGTISDVNGNYTLNAASNATLVFSFIGMATEEVIVDGRTVINVAMMPDIETLQEIVVVGYGTRMKTELTGSISSIRSEDIAGHTMPSFETAMHGRAAGVHISAGSGKLGQVVRTRIRGASSISASNQPLIVIDGVPVITENLGTTGNEPTNPLADLNPADIESIQVLKDASAAAIYGSRATNGVILITTKRGKEGKTQFSISTQYGASEASNKVGYLNREQYLDLWKTAYENRYGYDAENPDAWMAMLDSPTLFPYWRDAENPDNIALGPDVNWEDQALRRGSLQQFDISARGGSKETKYYVAISLLDQESIVVGNSFDRISGRLNLDQKANDYISFGMNMSLNRSRNYRVANDRAFASPLQMIALPPIEPTHNPETGELNDRTLYENGLIVIENSFFNTEVFRNFGNLYLDINLFEGLRFRSEGGIDVLNQQEVGYNGRKTNDGGSDGRGQENYTKAKIYNLENYFTYDKVFADDIDFNFVLGGSLQQADFEFSEIYASGFPSDDFKRIASASEILYAATYGTGYRYNSLFARTNLKFYNKYLLTLSARRDGSSRFGRDNRYGNFPSASIGWIVTNESFLENSNLVSFLKPRFSWGITGNSEIDNFAARGLYTSSNYAGLAGFYSISIPSPDLRWESTTQTNVGIDFGFFKNRISGEIDYYVKQTKDLLLNVQVPATTGFTSVIQNVGSMENKGWEFLLNTVNVDRAFKWTSSFNIAFNKNLVTDVDGQIIAYSYYRVMEGQPLGVFFMKEYAGVDTETGDALFYLNEEGDETTNNIAEASDRIVGDPNPDFWGGFSNTFSYKGFDLSVMFQFVYGSDIFNHGFQWQANGLRYEDNQTVYYYENFWKEPGDNTYYPEPRLYMSNGYGISSMHLFDGSYIRLKDVTLGYTIPKKYSRMVSIEAIKLFVRGYNLLTFTNYPGWDPEVSSPNTGGIGTQASNLQQNWDFYTAPQPRSITFGINLNF
jgi:TonB-dependent starch-binding outer membrane protein SusC